MKNKNNLNLLIVVIFLLVVGCSCPKSGNNYAPTTQTSQDIRAREEFAQKEQDSCPFQHVLFHATGNNKDILEISIVDEVSSYSADGVAELLVSDDLKSRAKALKFSEIKVTGGSRSMFKEDTINKSIPLTNYSIPETPRKTSKQSDAKTSSGYAIVISENANLRKLPNSTSEVIETLGNGTKIQVLRQKGAWFYVMSGIQEGWLHGNTIRLE